jgi:hypothetical protein
VFSLAGIPLFAVLNSARGRTFVDALARAAERPGLVYLLNVPNIAVALWLGPKWPTTHNLIADWANLTGAALTFLWGFDPSVTAAGFWTSSNASAWSFSCSRLR